MSPAWPEEADAGSVVVDADLTSAMFAGLAASWVFPAISRVALVSVGNLPDPRGGIRLPGGLCREMIHGFHFVGVRTEAVHRA